MNNTDIIQIVAGVVILLSIEALFFLWAARIFKIEGRSYGGAFGIAVLGGISSFILSFIPVAGRVLSPISGVLVCVLAMMSIFNTKFSKALGATVLAIVLFIVVTGLFCILSSPLISFLGQHFTPADPSTRLEWD